MPLTSLLFKRTLSKLGTSSLGFVEFDVATDIQHSYSAEVTSHPVESGADVSDNVLQKPTELTISGVISNTPVVFAGASTIDDGRAKTALENLLDLKDQGQPIDVVTPLREYTNMVITGITAPQNARVGDAVECTVTLKEVVTVASRTVDAPAAKTDRGTKKKSQGKKPTDEAPSGTESLLSRIGSFFGG